LEKAYAQLNHSVQLNNFPGQTDSSNIYEALAGGWTADSLALLTTGQVAAHNLALNKANFDASLNSGALLSLTTPDDTHGSASDVFPLDGHNIVANHEYAVLGGSPALGLYEVYNPWGVAQTNEPIKADAIMFLTWSEITDIFAVMTYAPIRPPGPTGFRSAPRRRQ
jgi:hypothetical protein